MASMQGNRPVGTDGTDFLHRERVASHYKVSATNKWRLKVVIFLHFHLWVLLLLKCLEELLDLFEIDLPVVIDETMEQNIPDPLLWEYMWLLSAIPAVMGWVSLPKNNKSLMWVFIGGTILLGVVPVLGAAAYMLPDLLEYMDTKKSRVLFFGYPMVVLCYIFFAIAIQLHLFSLYFAKQLVNSWSSSKKKQ